MATFDEVFEKDATFIFGSWVCTADGTGGWSRYLKPNKEKRMEAPSIDALVEKFSEMCLSNLVEGHERESVMIKIQAQAPATLLELDSTPSTSSITQQPNS